MPPVYLDKEDPCYQAAAQPNRLGLPAMPIFDLMQKLLSSPLSTLAGVLAVLALLVAFRALGILSRVISSNKKEPKP